MDRIDLLYYAHSSRIDLKEETRIKATSEQAIEWAQKHQAPNGGFAASRCFWVSLTYLFDKRLHLILFRTYSTSPLLWAIMAICERFKHLTIPPNMSMTCSDIWICWMGMDHGWGWGISTLFWELLFTVKPWQSPFQARAEAAINAVKVSLQHKRVTLD